MPGMNLTRDEARERADVLSVTSYDVDLDLTTGDRTFRSTTTVRFSCDADRSPSTFIDAAASTVHEVLLNDVALDVATVFADARISLSGLADDNELRVVADFPYMNTGEGLHRFVDPVDGEVYLYSQFEVADSRRMFTVFEQPDLKASFRFTVTAPQHWQVVGAMPTPEPQPAGPGTGRWTFGPTPRISSYVTSLIAGPYHVERSELTSRDGRTIPLGVFCRRSLAEFLDADEIVDVTRQGFVFFEELFDYAYPFTKYDQLFVPEFNAGAMENVGAVTILEDYVFRSKVADAVVERRADTILHELAHMWFGDLVTMRWWDDLWLNESFATFAATLCQAEATRWPRSWTTFNSTEKSWAYRQDQLSSTHPIAADIRDLEDVEVNFDGITYAKGASALKQLVAYVGRDEFFAGIRAYFRAHEWGNTSLGDLLGKLEETSGRDLVTWSKEWLETAGVATLRPSSGVSDDGTYSSFSVLQEATDDWPTLRSHRLGIGLYDRTDAGLVRRRLVELDIAGAATDVPELVGEAQPDLLLLNDEDLAYAKIRLDERSLATLVDAIDAFTDSLPRALCWSAAWDMTRDAEMPARDFIALVLRGVARESDSSVRRTLLAQVRSALLLYVDPPRRPETAALVGARLLELTRSAEAGSDEQLQFLRAFAASATTADELAVLTGLLDGTAPLDGVTVDTDLRWHLVHRLVSTGHVDETAIEAELERDRTAAGQRQAASARAARPTPAAKAEVWDAVVVRTDLPGAIASAMIGGFGDPDQRYLLEAWVEPYFAVLAEVWATRTNETAQNIVLGFYPTVLASQALVERTDSWLAANPDAVPALRRLLTESRDGVVRALRAQRRDAQLDA